MDEQKDDILNNLGKLYNSAPGDIVYLSVGADVLDALNEEWKNRAISRKEFKNAKNKRR